VESIEKNYQANLDYLFSFVDYSLTRNLKYTPEKFNLERMQALNDLMGNPHKDYPIIHVAGTKGKGSTAAMIASILIAADYRTGFYLSPHLQDFAERIQVNNAPIPHGALNQLVDYIKPMVEEIGRLSTFEITTSLAFEAFRKQHVDVAVVEVGLGGRVDSTNIINPVLSVITSLSMDHMNVLGDTLEKIAAEKAGIIKSGIPVVCAPQQLNALAILESKALEKKCELILAGRDLETSLEKYTLDGQWFEVRIPQTVQEIGGQTTLNGLPQNRSYLIASADYSDGVDYFIPLLGKHQIDNAATAISAILQLRRLGFEISDKAIQEGLANVFWPCRFEILEKKPPLVVDSAHNRDSANKLRKAMEDYFPGKPITLIFGASEDKDISGMFAELLPGCSRLILTKSTHPRAADLDTLIKSANAYSCPMISTESIEVALEFSLDPGEPDGVILAAGSLFIASAVREAWLRRKKSGKVVKLD
jgi:dihydrofolate synthase/folylpolyglutamate synthase